ncbi:LTA synthase family protein [Flavobacterium sp. '19STA2R22 D10 B1']|uniref:LTA synthase family protein n=1 Tax=Flavobacterium aerium TaxID=3037261 RepID=UPI00278C0905|nr:alkaline phosphatase family protein [Flavobacterium sp. '19STA2R22 D10 B1']
MTNYKNSLLLFIKRLTLLFIIYQICRILFYFFNASAFENATATSFFGGMRYDLSIIALINLVFGLAHLIPGNFKYTVKYQKVLKVLFYTVNLIFITTNFVDLEYYKFTGRRSNINLITAKGMEHEIMGLIPSFLAEFWYVGVLFLIICYLFWKAIPNLRIIPVRGEKLSKKEYFKQYPIFLFSIAILLVMGRGGFQKKPLRIVDAIEYADLSSTALVLNTPFTIIKSIEKKGSITVAHYYKPEELASIYSPVVSINPEGPIQKKNVVIIILESFGDENIGYSNGGKGYTPFLDSLITQSYYFKNGFANGKVSIDAVPSVLSSIPSLMNNSFISSSYSLNKINGLPKIMEEHGYNTSFFHGAFNGSQNFNVYTEVAGFDKYYGKDQYPLEGAFDGRWGIFDEEFLQYFCTEISTFKQPFFTSIFTISSHNPYIMPEKYTNKFPKGTTPIHETIGYADYALKRFFDEAKKKDWYNNTLFVITADHTSPFSEGNFSNNIGKFSIPIIFFDPSNPELKGVSEKNLQQIDIMPSILDYLNMKTDMISFGKSYKSKDNFVVYYLDNIYHLVDNDLYLAFDGNKSISLYNWKTDPSLKNNLIEKQKDKAYAMERFLKAYIQTFNDAVINDKLCLTKKQPISHKL